jgi:hypothetical protein
MSTPSLTTTIRYIELHQQYLRDPQSVLPEYKRLDLQFALRGWSVSTVKNFVRKEQSKCTSAPAQ